MRNDLYYALVEHIIRGAIVDVLSARAALLMVDILFNAAQVFL